MEASRRWSRESRAKTQLATKTLEGKPQAGRAPAGLFTQHERKTWHIVGAP